MAGQPSTSEGSQSSIVAGFGVFLAIGALMYACTPEEERGGTLSDAPVCNLNYTGCLDVTFDLDCGDLFGTSVVVVGVDEYGLDADFDGIACE